MTVGLQISFRRISSRSVFFSEVSSLTPSSNLLLARSLSYTFLYTRLSCIFCTLVSSFFPSWRVLPLPNFSASFPTISIFCLSFRLVFGDRQIPSFSSRLPHVSFEICFFVLASYSLI
uniref:Uncharacterized protein n=1 Tax=Cacopsylla melanoneura TaxID=428564 RepID=A0A8D9BP66_9HEMI